MPENLVSGLYLYWILRGKASRARAFLRRVEEMRALLRALDDDLDLPPESPIRQKSETLRITARQIAILRELIERVTADCAQLVTLNSELAAMAATNNPILADPSVRAMLGRVVADLPASIAASGQVLDKLKARLKKVEGQYRRLLGAFFRNVA